MIRKEFVRVKIKQFLSTIVKLELFYITESLLYMFLMFVKILILGVLVLLVVFASTTMLVLDMKTLHLFVFR